MRVVPVIALFRISVATTTWFHFANTFFVEIPSESDKRQEQSGFSVGQTRIKTLQKKLLIKIKYLMLRSSNSLSSQQKKKNSLIKFQGNS